MQDTHDDVRNTGLWVSISELARLKGVSKQAVARRVDRLESQGLIKTRPGERGTKLVNLAEYDRAVGETLDAVRALNGAGANAASTDPILVKEQARRTAYEADMKKLDLEARLAKLIPADEAAAAMAESAAIMLPILDGISDRADELARAVAEDGAVGARQFLKVVARQLRNDLATALNEKVLAAATPRQPN